MDMYLNTYYNTHMYIVKRIKNYCSFVKHPVMLDFVKGIFVAERPFPVDGEPRL